jgi:hypothetical protein
VTGDIALWKPVAWVWVVCLKCRCKFSRRPESEQGDAAVCLECQGATIQTLGTILFKPHEN